MCTDVGINMQLQYIFKLFRRYKDSLNFIFNNFNKNYFEIFSSWIAVSNERGVKKVEKKKETICSLAIINLQGKHVILAEYLREEENLRKISS